jgi:hypothetical protein
MKICMHYFKCKNNKLIKNQFYILQNLIGTKNIQSITLFILSIYNYVKRVFDRP